MATDSSVRRVSRSEFAAFRRCRRAWWLGFLRGLTWPERTPGALELGSLTHVGMEVLKDGGDGAEAKRAVLDMAYTLVPDVDGMAHFDQAWLDAVEDAQNYVDGYVEWVQASGADQRYEYVSAEEEFEMPLVEIDGVQWMLTGKLDRRVRDRVTGLELFIDFKTCASFEQLIMDSSRNEQFPTYSALLEYNTGQRIMGGLWRMIRKVKRARDGDGKYFEDYGPWRFNPTRVDSVIARYHAMAIEMHEIAQQMDGETGDRPAHQMVVYPNPTHTCKWDCPFTTVCDMFDDGSRVEQAVSDLYVVSDPYERYRVLGREEE